MAQKTGALIFDETADRYDIRFDLNDYYGGLHCGDCLEVFVRGKWKPTRMEYGDNSPNGRMIATILLPFETSIPTAFINLSLLKIIAMDKYQFYSLPIQSTVV